MHQHYPKQTRNGIERIEIYYGDTLNLVEISFQRFGIVRHYNGSWAQIFAIYGATLGWHEDRYSDRLVIEARSQER